MKKYIVPEDRLRELIEAEEILSALEAGGVDNWSYYGDSFCDYLNEYGYEEFDEAVDRIISNYQEAKPYTPTPIDIVPLN